MTFEALPHSQFDGLYIDHTPHYLRVAFARPRAVLSNAVLNGGIVQAGQILNLKVDGEQSANNDSQNDHPEESLNAFCDRQGWQQPTVGMMTAASMKSVRVAHETIEDQQLAVFVTTGVANARRAGDRAEYRQLGLPPNDVPLQKVGTINTWVLCSAVLSRAAMAELMMVVTEAKAALMQELGIRSPMSGKVATGTGTDALAVVSGHGTGEIKYAGKHTLLGETVARLVMEATADSLQFDLQKAPKEPGGTLCA